MAWRDALACSKLAKGFTRQADQFKKASIHLIDSTSEGSKHVTELERTGERMIEGAYNESAGSYAIYLLHAASYSFAEPFCREKRILDLGCGSGYGAFKLAKTASRVDAVDVSAEAIEYARNRYAKDNLAFSMITPEKALPFPDNCFDVVISFQVIEHIHNDLYYLSEAARVLAEGGSMILITPDRTHRLFSFQKPWNRWHVREYGMEELSRKVAQFFSIEKALRMGMRPDVAKLELQRYALIKWLSLPFTLPLIPESVRRMGLELLQWLRAASQQKSAASPKTFSFGEETVVISEHPENSLNLVILAVKRPGQ